MESHSAYMMYKCIIFKGNFFNAGKSGKNYFGLHF